MNTSETPRNPGTSYVLYCLIRRLTPGGGPEQFFLIEKQGHPAFPPTKFRAGENLYDALVRPMEEDLGLSPGSYFPERELSAIANAGESVRYPGLSKQWYLYPVVISLTEEGRAGLEKCPGDWRTVDDILANGKEPNIRAIAHLLKREPEACGPLIPHPTMNALAGHWAASNAEGVRVARGADIQRILAAGDRAFNLRVADPYLPYQRQGLGFTWSFFTPRDKQDIHVHGLPAVEIYGVMEGRLQLWHKPMNERGVRVWRPRMLGPGDWAEVEPLHCHLAVWLDSTGLGTVVKAAAQGELAGVGRLGTAGKTSCRWKTAEGRDQYCANWGQCAYPQQLRELESEFTKSWELRDFPRIAGVALQAQAEWGGG